jgi:uncharacterized protein (TIGR02266 family)
MRDIGSVFREFARLDLLRIDQGLSVPEFERWAVLKKTLDRKLRGSESRHELNRRSSRRIATRLRCSYASREELRRASITRLATGGVFIATTSPLPVGTKIALRIHIEESDSEIEVDGVVVSTNLSPDFEAGRKGMGIRFSMVSQEALEAIAELYATEAQREYDESRADRDAMNDASPPTEASNLGVGNG